MRWKPVFFAVLLAMTAGCVEQQTATTSPESLETVGAQIVDCGDIPDTEFTFNRGTDSDLHQLAEQVDTPLTALLRLRTIDRYYVENPETVSYWGTGLAPHHVTGELDDGLTSLRFEQWNTSTLTVTPRNSGASFTFSFPDAEVNETGETGVTIRSNDTVTITGDIQFTGSLYYENGRFQTVSRKEPPSFIQRVLPGAEPRTPHVELYADTVTVTGDFQYRTQQEEAFQTTNRLTLRHYLEAPEIGGSPPDIPEHTLPEDELPGGDSLESAEPRFSTNTSAEQPELPDIPIAVRIDESAVLHIPESVDNVEGRVTFPGTLDGDGGTVAGSRLSVAGSIRFHGDSFTANATQAWTEDGRPLFPAEIQSDPAALCIRAQPDASFHAAVTLEEVSGTGDVTDIELYSSDSDRVEIGGTLLDDLRSLLFGPKHGNLAVNASRTFYFTIDAANAPFTEAVLFRSDNTAPHRVPVHVTVAE